MRCHSDGALVIGVGVAFLEIFRSTREREGENAAHERPRQRLVEWGQPDLDYVEHATGYLETDQIFRDN
jgi:hypothetical protein